MPDVRVLYIGGWGRSGSTLTERLLATHMTCLASAAEPMPGQGELLDWLRGRYRLAVVSNFDYTPTVLRILADSGILGRFETVYPKRVTREDIRIVASILAVGAAYEAMTSDRVYRMAIGPEAAREELLRWSGKQFSPEVVKAFLRVLDREGVPVS